MSPSLFLRVRISKLALVAIAIVCMAVALVWATGQHAGASASNWRKSLRPAGGFAADKRGVTPEAAAIVVNSLSDVANASDGLCTLREAITAANNNAPSGGVAGECAPGSGSGSDAISFTVTGTIDVNNPLPDISSDLTITGPGSSQLTVHRLAPTFFRIFNITSGVVGLSGLGVTNGLLSTPPNSGGAGIQNLGTLTMNDVVVSSNVAGLGSSLGGSPGGGGISNQGTLTLTNCSITGNSTANSPDASTRPLQGGGIYNTGQMTITATAITNNLTGNGTGGNFGGHGGGIYNATTTSALLINSTVSGNATGTGAQRGFGGGIDNETTMTIVGSTISGNTDTIGGAIINHSLLVITNSTVSGNHTDAGIHSSDTGSRAVLTNCTITANDGTGVVGSNVNSTLRNTIVAANGSGDLIDRVASLGHNFIGAGGSANFVNGVNGDQVGNQASPLNPQLGPLANNGGPTMTHMLLAASPAIDAGDDCVTQATHCGDVNISQITTDQRGPGFGRQVDGPDGDSTATVDIGAYEMQTPLANLPDTSTNEDTQLLVAFDGGDASTIASVTATSSDATLVPNDAAHLSVAMTGSTGLLTINQATNLSGTTNITVTINRTGGPESRTFILTVNPVNDAPSFTKGADQVTNEDNGVVPTTGWATNISPGPADESGQVLTFQVTGNTNPALFSAGPAISATGTLTFTPADNANGSATITINLKDNGGTTNGGVDTSASQSFTVTVNAVNDAPSFTKGAGQVVSEDAGAQTVNNWATSISPGPNEAGQTVSFTTSNNNNALFSTQPAISSTGTLTYTPAANANGSATVTATLKDNGGTANGGVDTSTAQTFTITVNPVADTPSATNATTTVNTQTTSGLVITRNAADGSEVTNFKITNIQNGTLFKNDGVTQINNNGFITFAEGNAGLKFTPSLNSNAAGSFQVQASVSNSDAGLGGGTATATITVSCGSTIVTNSNDSGAGSLRGTINSACIGDTITFDMSVGHVTSPITLTSGQLSIDKDLTITGPGANLLSVQRSTASGTPDFGVFTINSGKVVTISGLTISNGRSTNGGGISNAGTLTINRSTISGNTSTNGDGGGVFNFAGSISTATLTINNSTISGNSAPSGGGIYNIGITSSTATLTINNSTISGNSATNGGGIYNDGFTNSTAAVTINSSTVSGNSDTNDGGGILNTTGGTGGTATLKLGNTIVAGNLRNNLTPDDINGAVDPSSSFNLIGVNSGLSGITNGTNGNQIGTSQSLINPRLAPLTFNGGTTQTMALLSGSPALDAGSNTLANNVGLTFDQRGTPFARSVDGPDADTNSNVDIGAFEAQVSVEDISDKSTNEDTQLQFNFNFGGDVNITSVTATSSNTTLVPNNAANIALSGSGPTRTLTINPVANLSGTSTITVTVNGNNTQTMTDTFLLTINSVNDAPSFTKGADRTVIEDAGAQTVTNWATSISAGPDDESGQTVTFTVTNNNNALFSSQPAVGSTGTLTFTPAADANGSATVTVTAKDNGGTANGGNDTSPSQTFTITVNAVNDAPSFTEGADQTVGNNAGNQTVAGWATNISAGPANESGQTLTFQVTGNTNPGLFTAGPTVSSAGTLTYTPSASAGGSATITINLKDNGGTANGGVDTSAAQTFTITVTPIGGFVNFASSTGNTTENSGSTTVNVVRTGDTSKAMTVNYATNADTGVPCATANGMASPKCDFTTALGTLNFAAGETNKPITILISQDSFVEGPEVIMLTLSSPTGGSALGTPSTMSITIADDASEPPTNIIDDANTFVRMHYHDFLNREGDQSGLDFWTGQMTNCGNSDVTVCRVNVSGAFFLSIEFQQTGYLVERIYKTAYADATATSTIGGAHSIFVPVVRANEFLTDTQRIGRGVVVLQPGWETVLENNKQAYALEFVQTSRFVSAYPTTMTPAQFVDKLNTNVGNVLSASERTTAINLFGNAAVTTNINARAQALRQVAEDADLYNAEFNRAFVLTQYIGYLRRNPNDAPDSDYSGYDFWLGKLNQFNGDYVGAEMVKAFISSSEYRQRFGP